MFDRLDAALGQFYTLGEAARAVGRNRKTVWLWIRDGKLEARHVGREVLVERTAVEELAG